MIEPIVIRTARCMIVGLTICSWLAISNHCAFAALAVKAEAPQSGCPFHSKPAKPKEAPVGTQCCKVLRGLVFPTTKSWTRDDAKFSDVELGFEQLVIFSESHSNLPLLLDTGPPGKTSFVELIGSVRAHAPPLFASE